MGLLQRFFQRETGADALSPLSAAHRARQELFAEYWNYYRGRHHKPLKVRQGEADDNVTINLAKKVVNTSVHFLFGDDVTFEVDADANERTAEERFLDDVWADRPFDSFSKMAFLQDVGINGAVFGTPFVRLYPGDGQRLPRVVAVDPMLVDVVTDDDDMTNVQSYSVIWKVRDTYRRDYIERVDDAAWDIARQTYEPGARWVAAADVERWPWKFAPLFHCKNLPNPRDFWGISDLEDEDINDALNFVMSNTGRIIKHHAHPKTVGTGVTASQVNATSVDGFWAISSTDAKVANLEMTSDLSSSRAFAADIKQYIHEITDTPNLDPASVQVGALSGFALRILYGPQLSKTVSKRRRYGGLLSRLNAAILITSGRTSDERIVVQNVWSEALPVAGQERAVELQTLTSAGASIYGAAKVVGYTEDEAQLLSQVETFDETFTR